MQSTSPVLQYTVKVASTAIDVTNAACNCGQKMIQKESMHMARGKYFSRFTHEVSDVYDTRLSESRVACTASIKFHNKMIHTVS
jgi:hypothetical protein